MKIEDKMLQICNVPGKKPPILRLSGEPLEPAMLACG